MSSMYVPISMVQPKIGKTMKSDHAHRELQKIFFNLTYIVAPALKLHFLIQFQL